MRDAVIRLHSARSPDRISCGGQWRSSSDGWDIACSLAAQLARRIVIVRRQSLGPGLNQAQKAMMVASATAERKFAASLSYRVAMGRKSLRRQKALSMRQRSW